MAEGTVGDEFSLKSNGNRAGREGAGGDGFIENCEGALEAIVLRGEIAHEDREARLRV